ncbi:hypothetical protein PGT21_007890 [Puccinia graminis f. sp. tritici]|uniref:Uncharacterized protein n=1 Tax=Puccinia graminis f. sp. tritici TaxID=56615 RepID=A0A5B0QU88_PUCGR|nr:hypothetical protein PGT21_007890 [Puccinia graminis f. sp. tritici]
MLLKALLYIEFLQALPTFGLPAQNVIQQAPIGKPVHHVQFHHRLMKRMEEVNATGKASATVASTESPELELHTEKVSHKGVVALDGSLPISKDNNGDIAALHYSKPGETTSTENLSNNRYPEKIVAFVAEYLQNFCSGKGGSKASREAKDGQSQKKSPWDDWDSDASGMDDSHGE